MRYKATVSISIVSKEHSVDNINCILALEPDEMYRKGELIKSLRDKRYIENCWTIRSNISEKEWVEEHIKAIKKKVNHCIQALKELSLRYEIVCNCVIWCSSEPPLNFPPDAIQFLADIGAGLDIDQYIDTSGDF